MTVVGTVLREVKIVRDREAGHACPTVSNFEKLQCIHKSYNLRLDEVPLKDSSCPTVFLLAGYYGSRLAFARLPEGGPATSAKPEQRFSGIVVFGQRRG
jgi:hypothetical protein